MKKTELFFRAEFSAIRFTCQDWQVGICTWDEESRQWCTHGTEVGMPVFQLGECRYMKNASFTSLYKAAISLAKRWPEETIGIVAFPSIPDHKGELLLEFPPMIN
jgi:hypothetical protein